MADNNLEELKLDLVSEIQQRVTDKILEQSNADLLIKLINQAETETEAMNIAALGTTYKRTGFHFDKRLEKISNNIKYKAKNDRLSFVNDENRPTHELIIGDNYDALQNLLITHKGKIDVIYIDPPYGKDDMGVFADTNYNNSITRDNLLSMLYPRLLMAKRLLTSDGVIFCSIDDKNQAYVKCLFDEIFGEENFVATMCRETIKGGSKTRNIKQVHDYILVYAKVLNDCDGKKELLLGEEFEDEFNFRFEDDKGKYAKGRELNKWGAGSRREDSPSMWFPIPGPNNEEIYPIRNDGSEGRWRWGKAKILKAVSENDVIYEKRDDGTFVVYEKIRENREKNKQLITFLKEDFINAKGSDDLKRIFGTLMSSFDYAKPQELITFLIKNIPSDDLVILDFFAGSGTTGQAVMELNKEDGGNRTFILCTNNEITDKTPNGIAYDVTAKRLKRVMSGECYDGTNNFPWLEDHEPYRDNLNVYEIETVSKTEYKAGETAFDKIDETCYGLPKFEKLTDKIEWVCKNFENATKMEGVKSC